jgi:hypothetical protein
MLIFGQKFWTLEMPIPRNAYIWTKILNLRNAYI